MKFRGGIWLPEDGIEGEIHAKLTISEADDEIIVAAEDDYVLGKWQLAEVVVEPQGDSDFLLTRKRDELVFRPDSQTGYKAFAIATALSNNSASVRAPIPRGASSSAMPDLNTRGAAAHASGRRKSGRWKNILGSQGKHAR